MRRRRLTGRSAAALLLTVPALVLAACSIGPSTRPPLATYGERPTPPATSSSSAPAVGPGGPGQQAEPLDWQRCSGVDPSSADGTTFAVECAELEVPLSYSDAATADPDLRLAVTRARTSDTPQDAPDLVVVLGGPGANGAQAAAEVASTMPDAVLAGHAIVTVDLRGAGGEWNTGLACFEPTTVQDLLSPPVDPTTDSGSDQLTRTAQQVYFNCNDTVGPSITGYGTNAAADDLDSLRSALGTDTLLFLGRGYGATLGAVYAHRYPARVGRMVLDGPADPLTKPTDAAATRAAALEAALDDFAADCAATECPLGDDPKAAITGLIDDLGDIGSTAGRWLFTGGSVLLLLSETLGRPDRWDTLAEALAQAIDGNVEPAASLLRHSMIGRIGEVDDRIDGLRTSDSWLEPPIAYRCNDTAEHPDSSAVNEAATAAAAKAPIFGAFLTGRAGLCAAWPSATSPVPRLSGEDAAPILVIGAVKDPVAPYSQVKAVTNQLASAQLLSWQSGAHGAVGASSCVGTAVTDYLDDGSLPDKGRLCPP